MLYQQSRCLLIAELQIVAKPCILVPSPNVSEDHQTKNAMALVEVGAALLVKDADAIENLVPELLQLFTNENQQKLLQKNIQQLAILDAADRIAKELVALKK